MVAMAKQAVEAQCPGVVSCADILAIAARDAVVKVGGPSFDVLKGRRDGRVSQASDVAANMPTVTDNVDALTAIFASKGLDSTDMVALSGAHTIGYSHCEEFTNRLYPSVDLSMNPNYAQNLEQSCPQIGVDSGTVVPFDLNTPFVFDNMCYTNLVNGEGLLTSDKSSGVTQERRWTLWPFPSTPIHSSMRSLQR